MKSKNAKKEVKKGKAEPKMMMKEKEMKNHMK